VSSFGEPIDTATAEAFASSWNSARDGSVYTREQFLEWFEPLGPTDFFGKSILELGFGNGSLLFHMGDFGPSRLSGVELGDTLEKTGRNLSRLAPGIVDLHRGDLTTVELGLFDLVYSIGVLHHLREPDAGFRAMLRHTKPGGRFHGWVYAREGNGVIRLLVEPIRRAVCRLPWRITKYGFALPFAVPFFLYAKFFRGLSGLLGRWQRLVAWVPLYRYCLWIAERRFPFFHHVAFDQLVTPQTAYLERQAIERWLDDPQVDASSVYLVFRNGNSWKFGGRKKPDPDQRPPALAGGVSRTGSVRSG